MLAAELPLESLVLETDAPDMMPYISAKKFEHQKQRNSPENISLIFEELVKLRKEAPQVIEIQLEKNMAILESSYYS
jgi:Tat protein secretion system quality control protein TatD with DNase activity